ncbi:MAG: hypothetical protein ACOYYS_16850 [Chloroflexota bacterium]
MEEKRFCGYIGDKVRFKCDQIDSSMSAVMHPELIVLKCTKGSVGEIVSSDEYHCSLVQSSRSGYSKMDLEHLEKSVIPSMKESMDTFHSYFVRVEKIVPSVAPNVELACMQGEIQTTIDGHILEKMSYIAPDIFFVLRSVDFDCREHSTKVEPGNTLIRIDIDIESNRLEPVIIETPKMWLISSDTNSQQYVSHFLPIVEKWPNDRLYRKHSGYAIFQAPKHMSMYQLHLDIPQLGHASAPIVWLYRQPGDAVIVKKESKMANNYKIDAQYRPKLTEQKGLIIAAGTKGTVVSFSEYKRYHEKYLKPLWRKEYLKNYSHSLQVIQDSIERGDAFPVRFEMPISSRSGDLLGPQNEHIEMIDPIDLQKAE